MKKNDEFPIEITDITSDGSGIGKVDGMTVFVPLTAVGDTAKVKILKAKKTYAYGKAEEWIVPSPDRIENDCPVFSRCGGCVFRHITYEAECTLKERRVQECVKRIGGIDLPPQPFLPAPNATRYRNKAQNESVIPVFLNILRIDNTDVKKELIYTATVLLSKFFFVAKTMSGVHANSITNVYNEIAECISRGNYSYAEYEEKCRAKIEKKKCWETFSAKLSETIYDARTTTLSKYLLYILELFYSYRTYTVHDILLHDEATVIYFESITTEHIASKNGYGRDGIEITPADRNKLGNLTIIGSNVNNILGDKPFEVKRTFYVRSSFDMTREIALKDTWTNLSFSERQQQMIERAKQVFTI
ncbi:MAG: DUF1524 domain-containing protein [Clostridia bacterium]|nr:DUF1524 domain-containing protein [Clostridia bacterium]